MRISDWSSDVCSSDLAIREEVGEPNLKVQMDFYHVQIMEGDIAMTFRKFQPHVGHIQIAGVPERHEPDTGEVNYAYLFDLLDDQIGRASCRERVCQYV